MKMNRLIIALMLSTLVHASHQDLTKQEEDKQQSELGSQIIHWTEQLGKRKSNESRRYLVGSVNFKKFLAATDQNLADAYLRKNKAKEKQAKLEQSKR